MAAPPGPFRMMWLLARTGALRWVNRWSGQFSRKRKSAKRRPDLIGPHWAGRTATPRRPRVSWSLLAILGLLYWLGILGFSFHALGKLAYQIQLTDPAETRIAITTYAYEEMLKAEGKLTSLSPEAAPDELRNKRRLLDELEGTLRTWSHMHLGREDREDRVSRAREMVETFAQRGSAAFRPVERFKAFPP